MDQPMDLESAVLSAWRSTADELVGVLAILDAYADSPTSEEMARALDKARRKDATLVAAMAGRASMADHRAEAVGHDIEKQARAAYRPTLPDVRGAGRGMSDRRDSLLSRALAHLAA